jgi:hypothetical protein
MADVKMKKKVKPVSLFIAALLILFFIFIGRILIGNIFCGNIYFSDKHIGETLTMEDGQKFVVLRRLVVRNKNNDADNFAVFKVRFKFKNLKFDTNLMKRLIISRGFISGNQER